MKLKIHIQLKTEPTNIVAQKPPFDRRKILLFIVILMTPAVLLATYYGVDNNDNALTAERGDGAEAVRPMIALGLVGERSDRANAGQPLELLPSQTPASSDGDGTEAVITMTAPGVVGASSERVGAESVAPEGDHDKQQLTGQLESQRVDSSAHMVRTVLTSGIASREPVDDLGLVIRGKVEQKVYLFSEVRGMTGQQIIHRWLLNDRVMANIKLSIGGERWRTYSSKIITPAMTGHWRTEVIDSAGQLLTAHNFDYYH